MKMKRVMLMIHKSLLETHLKMTRMIRKEKKVRMVTTIQMTRASKLKTNLVPLEKYLDCSCKKIQKIKMQLRLEGNRLLEINRLMDQTPLEDYPKVWLLVTVLLSHRKKL